MDGDSEFQASFEQACQQRGVHLFVLPPRSPKLNGHVERAQRTHTEEFYEVHPDDLEIVPLNQALQKWERVYNHVRPHQSLGYLTPFEYLSGLNTGTNEAPLTLSADSHAPGKSRPETRQGAAMARGP